MSNMYEEVEMTWNPLGGECSHKCSYCYVNSWKKRSEACRKKYSGEIRLYESEFKGKLKGKVFVCSMNDLFADTVPDEMIYRIVEHCKKFENDAEFLFQSKNTVNMSNFHGIHKNIFPKNSIFCTTIEADGKGMMTRALWLANIQGIRQITIEPIMDFNLNELVEIIYNGKPHRVAIGADSKKNNLKEPSKGQVEDLIKALKLFVPEVILKDNLKRLLT